MSLSKWQEASLGQCVKVQGGFAFKSVDFCSLGVPVIKIKNVRSRYIDVLGADCVNAAVAESARDYLLNDGDILISMTGSGLNAPNSVVGRVARYVGKSQCILINQRVGRLAPKDAAKLDKRFLFFLLSQNEVQDWLVSNSTGSANQANISNAQIECLRFLFPPIEDQRAIAGVLGVLDDKIELNRRMNATLEAMARALFKSWFVDFDPIRAKMEGKQPFGMDATTAALFPSRLTPSPLGNIPEGWGLKKFGDIIEPQKGKSITKKTVSEGDVPVVAGGLDPAYYHNVSNAEAPVITVSASGANAGFVRLYYENVWASDCSYINKTHTPFVYSAYALLKSRQEEIYGMQQGAAQPHIYPSDIMRLEVVNPPSAIWKALERLISSFHMQIAVNYSEIKSLEVIRDYLLPKLISGDIRIPNVEKFVEVA